jgi:hypothetical protein
MRLTECSVQSDNNFTLIYYIIISMHLCVMSSGASKDDTVVLEHANFLYKVVMCPSLICLHTRRQASQFTKYCTIGSELAPL